MCESCKKYRDVLQKLHDLSLPLNATLLQWSTQVAIMVNEALDSIPEPVEEERTCGTCGNLGMYTGVCENCNDTNSRWKPRIEGKEL